MSSHLDVSAPYRGPIWGAHTGSCPQRAISIVNGAIEEDVKQNYAEALKQYQFSLDYFVLALKCVCVRTGSTVRSLTFGGSPHPTDEKNEKLKVLIRAKIEEYLARAETLKTHMKDKQTKKAVSAGGGPTAANGDKK